MYVVRSTMQQMIHPQFLKNEWVGFTETPPTRNQFNQLLNLLFCPSSDYDLCRLPDQHPTER